MKNTLVDIIEIDLHLVDLRPLCPRESLVINIIHKHTSNMSPRRQF